MKTANETFISNGLGRPLNKAKYVLFDEDNELFYVWHGGTTVNVYDKTGKTVDMWMEEDRTSWRDIMNSMHDKINESYEENEDCEDGN